MQIQRVRPIVPSVVRLIPRGVALALVVLTTAVGEAGAQAPLSGSAADRWSVWAGCWEPSDTRASVRDLRVCIVPSADRAGARFVTYAGDRQLNEESIVPDGAAQTASERGCRTERRTRWAASGPRLFSSGQVMCEGQDVQPTSAISTLLSNDRWLDVQVSGPAGREVVRLAHYARSSAAPPAAIADALAHVPPASGRLSPRVNLDDVVEASRAVASPAVEAWVTEAAPRLAMNRGALRTLSAAKVSEPVIDLLIGFAFPKQFEIRRPQSGGGGFLGMDAFGYADPFLSTYGPWDFGWGPYGSYASLYSPFAFGLPFYGSGYYPYRYDGYLYGGGVVYGGGVINVPVAPSGGGEPLASGTGVAVNGRGYTRVQPREAIADNAASGRSGNTFSSMPSDAGGAAGGGASVSPGGYSSGDASGGGGGGNFAVPR